LLPLPMLLFLCACGVVSEHPTPRAVNFYMAEEAAIRAVRRVLVVPFDQEEMVRADERTVRAECLAELRKLQAFDVLALPEGNEEDEELRAALTHGRLSVSAMVDLARRFRADAILTGTILQYRPYVPPVFGLRLQLLSVHTGGVVWAAEGVYDAGDAATRLDLKHYCARVAAPETSLHGWEMATLSHRRFIRFVTFRLLETWKEDPDDGTLPADAAAIR
jgi:hypothetical protein